jgi:hypothetical protein
MVVVTNAIYVVGGGVSSSFLKRRKAASRWFEV